jgi:hypothetical protein
MRQLRAAGAIRRFVGEIISCRLRALSSPAGRIASEKTKNAAARFAGMNGTYGGYSGVIRLIRNYRPQQASQFTLE